MPINWKSGRTQVLLALFVVVVAAYVLLFTTGNEKVCYAIYSTTEHDQPPPFAEMAVKARKGNARAERILGDYYLGLYTWPPSESKPDYLEAAEWYRKSADQGNTEAQYRLSDLYLHGYGVNKDAREAYFWALLALRGNYFRPLEAPRDALPCYLDDARKYSEQLLSSGEREAIKKRVEEWMKDHPMTYIKVTHKMR